MGIIDQYGTSPLTSAVLQRDVDDVLTAPTKETVATKLPYRLPKEEHPIAIFFSHRGKQNAAGIRYQTSGGFEISKIGYQRFDSHSGTRPPNPDYFFTDDIPYPVGYEDVNGMGMSYGWTPLGYLLYHDRSNKSDCGYYQIVNGYENLFYLEIWSRFLSAGHLLAHGMGNDDLTTIVLMTMYTDPPADLLPELMFGKDVYQNDTAMACALVEAALDFQHKWNCGAWFDPNNRHNTRDALQVLLGV
jgi:hypothetical protein